MRICSVQLGPLADYLKTVSTNLFVSPLFICLFVCLFVYCNGICSVICEMYRNSVCLMLNEFRHNYCLKHIFFVFNVHVSKKFFHLHRYYKN